MCRVNASFVATLGALLLCSTTVHGEVLRVLPTSLAGDSVALSGNGRFAVAEDYDGACGHDRQIVLFDRQTSQLECVSVNDDGRSGDSLSLTPSISADGQLVVFYSYARNLATGCELPKYSGAALFLRNRRTQRTSCLDLRPLASTVTIYGYGEVAISADGNTVVVVAGTETFGGTDAFAIRLASGQTTGVVERVTVPVLGTAVRDPLWDVAVSADGRFVAFASEASNLVPNDSPFTTDVFVRDLLRRTTTCITCSAIEATGMVRGFNPAISADGRFAVFSQWNFLGRKDLVTGEVVNVCPSLARLPRWEIEAPQAQISADGRFVLFVSGAQDIVPDDDNTADDLFVADLGNPAAIRYSRVNLATDGVTQANDNVEDWLNPIAMSADARVIAFISGAPNLVPADPNGWDLSVFLARIPGRAEQIVTGPGAGGGPHVRAMDLTGAAPPRGEFFAYAPAFDGGVSVAYGDVDGDGAADIVTGAGPGGGPHVRVFTAARYGGDGATAPHELTGFMAYDPAFTGGVSVAVGDVTGDGIAEIITAAGSGGGPHVRVFELQPRAGERGIADVYEYTGFFAYAPGFAGGVRVAVGDVDGDGVNEVITAAGPGGGADIQVFKLDGVRVLPVLSLLAYDPAFYGGVFVAAGDVDGDGRAEIVTGADAGGGPHVRVFSVGTGFTRASELAGFMAFDPAFRGGVRVAAGDVDGDGRAEIIAGAGPGGNPQVLAFHRGPNGRVSVSASFSAYALNHVGGVFVAAAPH